MSFELGKPPRSQLISRTMSRTNFHERDHTDAFWNEVDKVMPDYRERKEWLRRNGAGLDV